MADSKHVDILKALKKGEVAPIYLLCGEESFFIDQVSDFLEHELLTEEEKAFGLSISYGRETNLSAVIGQAKSFPMTGGRQVVMIKEAQDMTEWRGDAGMDTLTNYCAQPQRSTVLVVVYRNKKPDARKKVTKALKKHAVWLETSKVKEAALPGWIQTYARTKGGTISITAARLMGEYLGAELNKVANEIDKLLILVPQGEEITEDHIEKNIGISKSFNVFELTKALGKKDVLKSNRIINYFASNPKQNPMQMVLPAIYNYFIKILMYHSVPDKSQRGAASAMGIPPFFVDEYATASRFYPREKLVRIVGYLREADSRSKGLDNVGITNEFLMKELIYKILH